MKTLLDRITLDPDICHGKPCIRGLRYPVEMILELPSGDMIREEILITVDPDICSGKPVIQLAGLSASGAQHLAVLSWPDHSHQKQTGLAQLHAAGGVNKKNAFPGNAPPSAPVYIDEPNNFISGQQR